MEGFQGDSTEQRAMRLYQILLILLPLLLPVGVWYQFNFDTLYQWNELRFPLPFVISYNQYMGLRAYWSFSYIDVYGVIFLVVHSLIALESIGVTCHRFNPERTFRMLVIATLLSIIFYFPSFYLLPDNWLLFYPPVFPLPILMPVYLLLFRKVSRLEAKDRSIRWSFGLVDRRKAYPLLLLLLLFLIFPTGLHWETYAGQLVRYRIFSMLLQISITPDAITYSIGFSFALFTLIGYLLLTWQSIKYTQGKTSLRKLLLMLLIMTALSILDYIAVPKPAAAPGYSIIDIPFPLFIIAGVTCLILMYWNRSSTIV